MHNPLDVWRLGVEAYRLIKGVPEITRADLNATLKTSSDDRKNQVLSDAISSMLTLGHIRKFQDGTTVHYWCADAPTRFFADRIVTPHPCPIDVLGPAPNIRSEEQSPDMPEPIKMDVQAHYTPEEKMMARVQEQLKGILRDVYTVMMTNPLRVWRTADDEFEPLHENVLVRAQSLGRIAKMGLIKKYTQENGHDRVYTIGAACPPGYVEAEFLPSAAAKKKMQVAEDAAHRQRIINDHVGRTQPQEEEGEDDQPQEEIEEEVETEADDAYEPVAHLTSDQRFHFVRENGEVIDFTENESAAWRRLLQIINIDKLRD